MLDRAISDVRIVRANSVDMEEAVYAFRYSVYVEMMGRKQLYADHRLKQIREPLDERGQIYVALADGRVVGTVRRNFIDEPAAAYYREFYRSHLFESVPSSKIGMTTKLMVLPSLRGTRLPTRLLRAFAGDGAAQGIVVDLMDCNDHLVAYFERYGYVSYMDWANHEEYGRVRPMFVATDTIRYLRSIKSPLFAAFSPHVKDGCYGGYRLLATLATDPVSAAIGPQWDSFVRGRLVRA